MMPRFVLQIARLSAAVVAALAVFAPRAIFAADPPHAVESPRAPALPQGYNTEDEGWISLAYYPHARERVRPLLAQAEQIRQELEDDLGTGVLARVQVRIAAVPDEIPSLVPQQQGLGHGVAWRGVDLGKGTGKLPGSLVVLSLTSLSATDAPDLTGAFRYALAHLALDEAMSANEARAGTGVPQWFREGYAVHFAGADSALRIQTLAVALFHKRILGMSEIEASLSSKAPSPLAVAQAADFVRFLTTQPHRDHFAALIKRLRDGGPAEQPGAESSKQPGAESSKPAGTEPAKQPGAEPAKQSGGTSAERAEGEAFKTALSHAYGSDLAALSIAWQKDMAKRYSFLPILMGTALTWALIAVAVVVRRIRRRAARRPFLSRHARLQPSEASRKLAASPPVVHGRRSAREELLDEADLFDDPVPPDAEVPKVEHDGRWHTLH